jgi:hypothetical protein
MIERGHHALGVEDSEENKIDLRHHPRRLKWAIPYGFGFAV